MKKVIALLLSLVMVFAMVSVVAYAANDTAVVAEEDAGHGNAENDETYEEAYSVLNLLTDLFERINLLIEYIVTVFFPNINTAPQG